MPKRLAVRVGRMVPWKRQVAFRVWSGLPEGADRLSAFWPIFAAAVRRGLAVLADSSSSKTEEIVIHARLPRLSWREVEEMAAQAREVLPATSYERAARIRALVHLPWASLRDARASIRGGPERERLAWIAVAVFGSRWREWTGNRGYQDVHDLLEPLPMPLAAQRRVGEWLLRHRAELRLPVLRRVCNILAGRGEGVLEEFLAGTPAEAIAAEEQRQQAEEAAAAKEFSPLYRGVSRLAEEARRWSLTLTKEVERRWLGAVHIPRLHDGKWVKGEYRARFLPRWDPRGVMVGQHTDCCQHLNGAAWMAAARSHEHPESGVFVIEKGGAIVCQSWVWIGDEGGLVFDSVECRRTNTEAVKSLYEAAAAALALRYGRVEVGPHGRLSDLPVWSAAPRPWINRDDLPYRSDSDSARYVLVGGVPTKPAANSVTAAVRPYVEGDRAAILALHDRVYPEMVGEEAAIAEGLNGLVVVRNGEVVGWFLVNVDEREIVDIAVLPEWRGTPVARSLIWASSALLSAYGGRWKAEARESTSLRLIERMAARGRGEFRVTGDPVQAIGQDPLVPVEICV
jgi:ribosomal protein S18 acetylase RimI-like enzyme